MIKTLTITNFLSHADTEMEFSSGVNIIVGPTDSGKSAIIRALRWLIHNRPLGDSFRSSWGGDTIVELDMDDGQVARFRSDKDNMYILGMHDEFAAIRSEVPDEVVKFLNLNEHNLQSQFDSHFLLSRSAGEIAQYFNTIAHLDKIDLGIKNLQSWIRSTQSKISNYEEQMVQLNDDLQIYSNIDSIEIEVVALESLAVKIEETEMDCLNIGAVCSSVSVIDKEINNTEKIIKAEGEVDQILIYFDQIKDIDIRADELETLCIDIIGINGKINEHNKLINAETLVTELLNINDEIQTLKSKLYELNILFNLIEDVNTEGGELQHKLVLMEEDFHKNMGETCPLCGQKIN